MALSNWDTFSVDLNGTPLSGSLICPDGVIVEFDKNWLYLHDAQAWRSESYIYPVIMKVHHGYMRYRNIKILAERGPQNGIYALVLQDYYPHKIGMAGIGCYGFGSNDNYVGVLPDSVTHLGQLLEQWKEEYNTPIPVLHKGTRFNQGDAFFIRQKAVTGPADTPPGKSLPPIILDMIDRIF